jgi:LmbE family N-acetylglucosaminyl deacetylase
MSARKQQLLRRHRKSKRISMMVALAFLLLIGALVSWWLVPLFLALGWVVHEAWFADHLFYAPHDDYHYVFSDDAVPYPVSIRDGRLDLPEDFEVADTLILEVEVKATWLGRWLDPYVWVGNDRQDLERGVAGRRYLNLSGQHEPLVHGAVRIDGRFCQLSSNATLHAMRNPDYAERSLLIIAPHADDAELAAFGLYSRATDVVIVTLTQGEIEADEYRRRLGLNRHDASKLKGRLRSWDSLAVPLWGGVPQTRCVQLGYYCLQLPAMAREPGRAFGSQESNEHDIRSVRQHNPLQLPADVDGIPSWVNLQADLRALLEHFRPEVVVTPHPELDPHSDHVAATQALCQAIDEAGWLPKTLLLYANHLHDNDRWPMGPADGGVALPPAIEPLPADHLWSPSLDAETRLNKAMALAMQHDLQAPLPLKKRLRRLIQAVLVGRRWPRTGEDEFFRKGVRRHELFWVREL